jgi:hypothetical protein
MEDPLPEVRQAWEYTKPITDQQRTTLLSVHSLEERLLHRGHCLALHIGQHVQTGLETDRDAGVPEKLLN